MIVDCPEVHAPAFSQAARRSQRGIESLQGRLNESLWRQLLFLKEVQGHIVKWKEGTRFSSNPSDFLGNKHYKDLMRFGPMILPVIFLDLEHSRGEWFEALETLTGVDPIQPTMYGDYEAMRGAWLEWARFNGYR